MVMCLVFYGVRLLLFLYLRYRYVLEVHLSPVRSCFPTDVPFFRRLWVMVMCHVCYGVWLLFSLHLRHSYVLEVLLVL